MLVSIIITNYNYGRFLGQAIDSALFQRYEELEVVVVDDGSTDASRELLESYKNRVRAVLKPNGGQASAFNAGFAASTGEVICWLDADDVFRPRKARAIAELLMAHPWAGWCFHPVRYFGDHSEQIVGARSAREAKLHRVDLRKDMKRGAVDWTAPPTSGLCFRRSLLDEILPMPEAEGVTLHDNYQKFAAMALSEGLYSEADLAFQRLHEDNAYTLRQDHDELKARVWTLTALRLRERLPEIARLTDKHFAFGLALHGRAGRLRGDDREVLRAYWSSVPRARRPAVALRAVYHLIALSLSRGQQHRSEQDGAGLEPPAGAAEVVD